MSVFNENWETGGEVCTHLVPDTSQGYESGDNFRMQVGLKVAPTKTLSNGHPCSAGMDLIMCPAFDKMMNAVSEEILKIKCVENNKPQFEQSMFTASQSPAFE
jgi:hypothetical protein